MMQSMAAKGQVRLPVVPHAVHVPQVNSVSQLVPLAWIAGGILAGLLVQFVVLRPLYRLGRLRRWRVLASISGILASVAVLWGALAGIYIGLEQVTLTVHEAALVNRSIGALGILSITWVAARFAAAAVSSFGRRTDQRMFSASLFASVVQGAIIVVGILTVLSSFGIAIAPLLTTLGLGGLAVALALRDTLSNLFSGIHIVGSRQFRPGDYVKFDLNNIEGEIVDIKWRTTMIRDLQNNIIVVPNEKIAASIFVNYSATAGDIVVPINALMPWKGRSTDLEFIATRAAREATAEVAGLADLEKCSVELTAVNETNVQVTAYLPIGNIHNRPRAVSSFLSRLFDGAGRANMGVSRAPAAEAGRPAQ